MLEYCSAVMQLMVQKDLSELLCCERFECCMLQLDEPLVRILMIFTKRKWTADHIVANLLHFPGCVKASKPRKATSHNSRNFIIHVLYKLYLVFRRVRSASVCVLLSLTENLRLSFVGDFKRDEKRLRIVDTYTSSLHLNVLKSLVFGVLI
jgi:hypothetical protein